MNPVEYIFSTGSDTDREEVFSLSRSMDLDVQEFNIRDFCVVRRANHVVGFGRLRPYKGFQEIATIGIVEEERNKGLGSAVVNCLLKKGTRDVYLTCVIPSFFSRLGFAPVKEFPCELSAKYDFCRSFGYAEGEVHVMKLQR